MRLRLLANQLHNGILLAIVLCLAFNKPILAQENSPRPKITDENASELKLVRWLTRGSATDVVWSPDGKFIAVGSGVGVTIIDPHSPQKPLHILEDYIGLVGGLAFSQDSKQLAAGGLDGTTYVWNVDSGKLLAALHDDADRDTIRPESPAFIFDVVFSRDGTQVISAARNKTVRIWDIASRTTANVLKMPQGIAGYLAVSPTRNLLATAGWGQ